MSKLGEDDWEDDTGLRPALVWDSLLNCSDFSIAALTPLALSCCWHTGWEDGVWKEALEEEIEEASKTDAFTLPETEVQLVRLVRKRVTECEHTIRASFMAGAQEARRILHSAFVVGDAAKITSTWSHAFMVMKVFDLILLPRRFDRDKGVDVRREPTPHLPMWKGKGYMEPMIEAYREWPHTLLGFIQAHEEMKSIVPCGPGDNPEPSQGRKEALRALMKAANESNQHAKLKYVENNFVCAAIGLLACTLTPIKGRTLADILVEFSGLDNPTLRKQTDIELLRPLYIAACISPVCFLRGIQLSTGHVRIPLYECMESVRLPSLKRDNRRYELEASLADLIVSMACEGHSVYERGIARIATKFKTCLFDDEEYVNQYEPECNRWPILETQARKPLVYRVSQTLIRIAHHQKDEGPLVLEGGWVKRIFEEEACAGRRRTKLITNLNVEEGEITVNDSAAEDTEVSLERDFEDEESISSTLVESSCEVLDGIDSAKEEIHGRLLKRKADETDESSVRHVKEKAKKRKQTLRNKVVSNPVMKRSRKEPERPVLNKYSQMEPQNNIELLDAKKTEFTIHVPTHEAMNTKRTLRPIKDYEPRRFSFNKWKSMSSEFAELHRVVRKTLVPKDEEFATYVLEYTYDNWTGLCAEIRRDIFSQSSVVVHDCPVGAVCGIRNWDSIGIEELFDVDDVRECQDQSVRVKRELTERMCQSSIAQFIKGIGTNRVNLFLDIPIPAGAVSLPIHEFNDGAHYMYRENREFCWNTPLTDIHSLWALLGTESAISTCHIDAAGFATYVECLIGDKLWFIAVGDWENTPGGRKGWDVNKLTFQCVHLKPGSRLYMRPGQPHFVVTVNDCLAVGGHFYTSTNYCATLRALTLEHYAGRLITNNEHPTCPLLLLKLLDAHSESWKKRSEKPVRWRFPNARELASLLIIAHYMDQLYPEVPSEKHVVRWQSTKEFERDYGHAQKIIKDFWATLSGAELETLKGELSYQVSAFEKFLTKLDSFTNRKDRYLKIIRRKLCGE